MRVRSDSESWWERDADENRRKPRETFKAQESGDYESVDDESRAVRLNYDDLPGTKISRKKRVKEPRTPGRITAANHALLKRQNPELADEDIWAESLSRVEQGALLLRMPMELQVWYDPDYRERLYRRLDPVLRVEVKRYAKRKRMNKLMQSEKHVVALYTAAEDYLKERMRKIYVECQIGGNDVKLSRSDLELLEHYQTYMDSWQQVVLVTKHVGQDEEDEYEDQQPSEGIILNRPTPRTASSLREKVEEKNGGKRAPRAVRKLAKIFGSQVIYSGTGTLDPEEKPRKKKRFSKYKASDDSEEAREYREWRQMMEEMGSTDIMSEKRESRRRPVRIRVCARSRVRVRVLFVSVSGVRTCVRVRPLIKYILMRVYNVWFQEYGNLDMTFLHQFDDMEMYGSEEIAEDIYAADVRAACKIVEESGEDPQHFRVIQGVKTWEPQELDYEFDQGMWYSIAAARPLILKHCIGLSRPLWHEILEVVGGGLLETSELEIRKRKEGGNDY